MEEAASPEVRLELSTASEPQAVRRARRALAALEEFHGDDELAFNVRLLVSELVSNAVTHGSQRKHEHVQVVAAVDHHTLRVEVSDGGPGFILGEDQAEPTLEDASGRGLYLLRTLADRFGIGDSDDGGQVWFEIDLSDSKRSD